VQVLAGESENALLESETTLRSSWGAWKHLDELLSSSEVNWHVWELCVRLSDQFTSCWCTLFAVLISAPLEGLALLYFNSQSIPLPIWTLRLLYRCFSAVVGSIQSPSALCSLKQFIFTPIPVPPSLSIFPLSTQYFQTLHSTFSGSWSPFPHVYITLPVTPHLDLQLANILLHCC